MVVATLIVFGIPVVILGAIGLAYLGEMADEYDRKRDSR